MSQKEKLIFKFQQQNILKRYALDQVLDILKQEEMI